MPLASNNYLADCATNNDSTLCHVRTSFDGRKVGRVDAFTATTIPSGLLKNHAQPRTEPWVWFTFYKARSKTYLSTPSNILALSNPTRSIMSNPLRTMWNLWSSALAPWFRNAAAAVEFRLFLILTLEAITFCCLLLFSLQFRMSCPESCLNFCVCVWGITERIEKCARARISCFLKELLLALLLLLLYVCFTSAFIVNKLGLFCALLLCSSWNQLGSR